MTKPRISKSYVGNRDGVPARKSDTRTSENTWIPRDCFPVIESLFRRAEHLLKIPHLDRENTEDLQVEHYENGQKYDSHHDWGVSGYVESRSIALLLYLTEVGNGDDLALHAALPIKKGEKWLSNFWVWDPKRKG